MNTMIQRQYTVQFTTPAFLGNAEQSGQWRTPPFKHLLREWWRVAWAMENDPAEWPRMREVEGRLFGHAWLESDKNSKGQKVNGRQSLLRLRLTGWSAGKLQNMPPMAKVAEGNRSVPAQLYLGFGPVKKMSNPVDAQENIKLCLAYPPNAEGSQFIEPALSLMHAFGTVGGRSRNGWGSLILDPLPGPPPQAGEGDKDVNSLDSTPLPSPPPQAVEGDKDVNALNSTPLPSPPPQAVEGGKDTEKDGGQTSPLSRRERGWGEGLPLRPWQNCLDLEWAHAIGQDENGPLIWYTDSDKQWTKPMEVLGQVRKKVNSMKNIERKWLNQPVAGKGGRLPSSLRFKVRRNDDNTYYGVIFHMPCTPPQEFRPAEETLRDVWLSVHQVLDKNERIKRECNTVQQGTRP